METLQRLKEEKRQSFSIWDLTIEGGKIQEGGLNCVLGFLITFSNNLVFATDKNTNQRGKKIKREHTRDFYIGSPRKLRVI
jgi:hypothetical protein